MSISFRQYVAEDHDACLAFFDANCPTFFSPQEKPDYENFLRAIPQQYKICLLNDVPAGAFGLIGNGAERSINWILIDTSAQGAGLGSAMMAHVLTIAAASKVQLIRIAASHLSAPFFARFGAIGSEVIKDGWGPGIDRIDMQLVI